MGLLASGSDARFLINTSSANSIDGYTSETKEIAGANLIVSQPGIFQLRSTDFYTFIKLTTAITNIKLGVTTPTKIYLGATQVSKMYLGTQLVYQA